MDLGQFEPYLFLLIGLMWLLAITIRVASTTGAELNAGARIPMKNSMCRAFTMALTSAWHNSTIAPYAKVAT